MELYISARVSPKLRGLLLEEPADYRKELFSVGANALASGLQRYLRREAGRRHSTAGRLGAKPTGIISKGAARITAQSSCNEAIVSVPIVGIARAFHDLTIKPRAAKALTIPIAAAAYGHRVRELVRMGWTVFRPQGKDFLMGKRRDGDGEGVALYSLRKSVVVRQDRTLLPSDDQVSATITNAMARHHARKVVSAA